RPLRALPGPPGRRHPLRRPRPRPRHPSLPLPAAAPRLSRRVLRGVPGRCEEVSVGTRRCPLQKTRDREAFLLRSAASEPRRIRPLRVIGGAYRPADLQIITAVPSRFPCPIVITLPGCRWTPLAPHFLPKGIDFTQ